MSLSYFNIKKLRRQSKQPEETQAESSNAGPSVITSPPAPTVHTPSEEPAASPILDEEDQKFLERLAAIAQEPEGIPPPLPTRPVEVLDNGEKKVGKDAQEALMDGADKVPLPTSPPEITVDDTDKGKDKAADSGINRRKSVMSYFSLAQSKLKRSDKEKDSGEAKDKEVKKDKKKDKITDKDRAKVAKDLHAAAEAAKSSEQKEAEREQQDLTDILDQLNLSAVNNRVFSFSKESEELLNKFKLVLKDLVNGVPTAYNDLEKLLTDSENQLKKMYGSMPPFLQNLVKSLPAKMTAALGPELMAAQAEKPGFDGKQREAASGKKSKKSRVPVPSLKSLVSAEGAVATMLKSILNFLKLRFPALMTGTNVLLSLAVFLLLFVFWYCHKRGRETRLEKEKKHKDHLNAEGADSALASSASSFTDDGDSLLNESTNESAAKTKNNEETKAPLIIGDGKEADDKPSVVAENLPSVSHLPDPRADLVSEPVGDTLAKEKETPLQVPESK